MTQMTHSGSHGFSTAEISLLASLELVYGRMVDEQLLADAMPWIEATTENAVSSLPFGLIIDIGCLFDTAAVQRQRAGGTGLRTETVPAYEDDFLRRLAAEPGCIRIRDAMARLDETARAEAVAYLVHSLTARLGFQPAQPLSPAVARRLLRLPSARLLQILAEALDEASWILEQAKDDCRQLARLARYLPHLLEDTDVLTVEHIRTLRTLTQRTRFSQVVEVAASMEQVLPRRVKACGAETGLVETRIEDDNEYPVGGFSSISNSGSMENLVSSELIYMDQTGEFDLFDLRYSEGDLLYYARDEDVYFRARREYAFVLHPDLVHAKIKHSELPCQDMVLLMSLLTCLLRRLVGWLGSDDLDIRVIFLQRPGGDTGLQQEYRQAQLLFREWVDSGCVQVGYHPAGEIECANVILFSHARDSSLPQEVLLHCTVCGHRIRLYERAQQEVLFVRETGLFAQWTAAARELLGRLY